MNTKSLELVRKTLLQLSSIVDNLNSDNRSLIDFDLSLEKTRRLYEELSLLKLEQLSQKENSVSTAEINIEPTVIPEEQLSEQIDHEELKYIEEKETIDRENINIPKSNKEDNIDTEENIEFIDDLEKGNILEKQNTLTTPQNTEDSNGKTKKYTTQESNGTSKETLADQFESQKSLNDILSNIRNDNDFATQLQNRPIKDLKNAISLNDKIWFTRELFDGNNHKYIDTIERINNANSIDQAIKIVDAFTWKQDESSTKRFLELIYRRFV